MSALNHSSESRANGNTTAALTRARRLLRNVCPQTFDELHGYVRAVLGFDMPREPMNPEMNAPFDYLVHAFFENRTPRDCIVWANRGGGKTQLGAIATFLDMLFKPGIQIRILGGSFDQSSRMYAYLRQIIERDEFRDLLDGRATGRSIRLINGSTVEVLAQSEQSVRGQRVQKLRCDEVELFTPEVWQAAQFVTRSAQCGDIFVPGVIEAFSTMHRPFGMMQRLVDGRDDQQRKLFKWGILEVLAECPVERNCETCPLFFECEGRAKQSVGFINVDDALQQKSRTSPAAWSAEMLCQRPNRSDCVYPEFDPEIHIADCDPPDEGEWDRHLWVGGMDFGYRNPTVKIWAYVQTDSQSASASAGEIAHDEHPPRLYIVDEHASTEMLMEQHIEIIRAHRWPEPAWIGIDPASYQRHESSPYSSAVMLKRAGFHLRSRRSDLRAGIEAVRRRLRTADDRVGLVIHPRCTKLIKALQQYHYPVDRPQSVDPVKDGSDHACDALRYLIINLDRPACRAKIKQYA